MKTQKKFTVSVVGLGYVGSVLLAAMAKMGHQVFGVGRDKKKLSFYAKGNSPFAEPGLNQLLSEGVRKKRIFITDSHEEAVSQSQITFICVGTPSAKDGGLEMEVSLVAVKQIATVLKKTKSYHVICFRSTLFSGSTEDTLIPVIESISGKKFLKDFGVVYNPEFLREGIAVNDFFHPPFTLLGSTDKKSAEIVAKAYGYNNAGNSTCIKAPIIYCSIKEAEALKYTCNAFHALKITFANEVSRIYSRYNIDSQKVMEIFKQDNKLNISTKYLSPGAPYGGSCLGKDLRVLLTQAALVSTKTPILDAVIKSNDLHLEKITQDVVSFGHRKIGFLGLAFKEDTDDLRESPTLYLALKLLSSRCKLMIYDPFVSKLKEKGLLSKKLMINQEVENFLTDNLELLLDSCPLIILSNNSYYGLINKILPKHAVRTIYDLTDSRIKLPKNSIFEYKSPFV